MTTIKIRYCGGCNPDYDRVRLAKRIQQALGAICRFEVGKDAPVADWVLILQGCPTACAEAVSEEKARTIHIRGPQDAEAFIRLFTQDPGL